MSKFIPFAVVPIPNMIQAGKFASNNAESVYPEKEQANKERDAYRHILWQAMLANKYGETAANALGNMHENPYIPVVGGMGQPDDQRQMDLYNNKIGVEIGLKAKSMQEMMDEAKKVVEENRAKMDAGEGTY